MGQKERRLRVRRDPDGWFRLKWESPTTGELTPVDGAPCFGAMYEAIAYGRRWLNLVAIEVHRPKRRPVDPPADPWDGARRTE